MFERTDFRILVPKAAQSCTKRLRRSTQSLTEADAIRESIPELRSREQRPVRRAFRSDPKEPIGRGQIDPNPKEPLAEVRDL